MTGQPSHKTTMTSGIELKGSTFALPVFKPLSADQETLSQALSEKVEQAPEFFQNTPVVIDLQGVSGQGGATDFALLIGLLRSHGLVPIGVRGGDKEQNEIATSMELAIMSPGRAVSRPKATQATTAANRGRTRLVTQPVRSGQRVYAASGDLVVLAQVSSGAEVFADGNVHVYGTLRGRVLAGVKGDETARIFCQALDAELVSIAGQYRASEDLDDDLRGKPAQIYLEGQRLRIVAL